MAVFQMLSEVVCAEKLLGIVALAELVHCGQVLESIIPIWFWEIGEFLATVAARVMGDSGVCLAGLRP